MHRIAHRSGIANQNLLRKVIGIRKVSVFTFSPANRNRFFVALVSASLLGGIGGFVAADCFAVRRDSHARVAYSNQPYGGPQEVAAAFEELRDLFPSTGDGKERVSNDQKALEVYGYSPNSYHPEHLHSMVVRVQSTEDVVKVVNIARKYRIPIAPYSGGTSLEGHYSGVM